MTEESVDLWVQLHAPLRDARLVDPLAPLPPRRAPVPVPLPVPFPPALPEKEEGEGARARAGEREEESATPPANLWDTEIGQVLTEDRAWIERTLTAITSRVDALHESRRREWRDWQRNAVELAVTLASRLLHDKLAEGDFPVESVVRELIGEVGPGPLVVHLHPADLALLRKRLDGKPLEAGHQGLKFAADPALGRGDCLVESTDTLALSQLPLQLAEMRRRMLRSLGHAQA